jgi:hypothetical protein
MQEQTATVPAKSKAPAAPATELVNPFTHFARRYSSSATFFSGDFIQVNGNTGALTRGADNRPVDKTEYFKANMHEAMFGWVKWTKGQVEDRRLGYIIQGFEPPEREALGDLHHDPDPWRLTVYLPMKDSKGEVCCFTASSQSGIDAVCELCDIYARPGADRQGKQPVLQIVVTSYENKKYSRTVYKPKFVPIGWEFWDDKTPAPEIKPIAVPVISVDKAAPVLTTTSKSPRFGDMDDEFPF